MITVQATTLKNRLGEILRQATLAPVAIAKHGRVVAYLLPAGSCVVPKARIVSKSPGVVSASARTVHVVADKERTPHTRRFAKSTWSRRDEERAIELCASGDFRPSRWLRAGNPSILAGIAAMLASQEGFDRARMLGLAERLDPGITSPRALNRWLKTSPVHAARFLPMLRARMDLEPRTPDGGQQ